MVAEVNSMSIPYNAFGDTPPEDRIKADTSQLNKVLDSVGRSAINEAVGASQQGGSKEPSFEVKDDSGNSMTAIYTDTRGVDYKVEIQEGGAKAKITNMETGNSFESWGDPHLNVNGDHKADFMGNISFELKDGTKITLGTTDERTVNGMTLTDQVTITNTTGDNNFGAQVSNIGDKEKGNLERTVTHDGGFVMDLKAYDGAVTFEREDGSWVSQESDKSVSEYGIEGLKDATTGEEAYYESDLEAILSETDLDVNKEKLMEDLRRYGEAVEKGAEGAREAAGRELPAEFWGIMLNAFTNSLIHDTYREESEPETGENEAANELQGWRHADETVGDLSEEAQAGFNAFVSALSSMDFSELNRVLESYRQ